VILLVSAVREELGELTGEPLGIGAIIAGVAMARLIVQREPDGVVLIGTGGAYTGGPDIGTACVARRVGMGSGAALMGLGYTPRPPAPIPCDLRLVSSLALPVVDVLTVGAVTTDPVLADRLSDGWMVEHLEAFGVAAACAAAQIPFVAVLGITNQVGPNAHTQWLTHRNEAREAARAAVAELSSSA
jgi:nucleoside phosphorylase